MERLEALRGVLANDRGEERACNSSGDRGIQKAYEVT